MHARSRASARETPLETLAGIAFFPNTGNNPESISLVKVCFWVPANIAMHIWNMKLFFGISIIRIVKASRFFFLPIPRFFSFVCFWLRMNTIRMLFSILFMNKWKMNVTTWKEFSLYSFTVILIILTHRNKVSLYVNFWKLKFWKLLVWKVHLLVSKSVFSMKNLSWSG